MLAFNAPDRRDYESGLTIDLSVQPTGAFSDLNVEGRGFQGARNLLRTPQPFGTLQTLEVHSDGKSVRLVADGVVRTRPLVTHRLPLDEIGRAFVVHREPAAIKVAVIPSPPGR